MEEVPMSEPLETMSVDMAEDDMAEDDIEQQHTPIHLHNDLVSTEKPVTPPPAGTLLPGPMANAISFATRSTSFVLRLSTAIGGYGLGAAKVTTLSSLELGRGILDGILNKAGRDVFVGSPSELARADAESILEKSLESMHQTMSRLVFWTATGFHAAGTTVSTASQISQLFLSVLDQFFGSTDSSRAIASIITLIRREFQNPATGVEGERVGVIDLILGLCGLAYLQNRCRRMMQEESRRLGYEETVWDVIVLNDGERVDAPPDGIRNADRVQSSGSNDANDTVEAIENHASRRSSTDDDDDLLETHLRNQIIKVLPEGAKISMSTSTTITKTITVDIAGAPGMSVPSFPSLGLGLVSSEVNDPHQLPRSSQEQASNYRVVYKVSRNRVRNMPEDSQDENRTPFSPEELNNDNDGESVSPISPIVEKLDTSLTRSSKVARPTTASSTKRRNNISNQGPARQVRSPPKGSLGSENGSPKELSFTNWVADTNERTANQKRTRAPLDEPRKNTKHLTLHIPSGSAGPLNRKAYKKPDANLVKRGDKKTGIRSVLGKGSVPTLSNLLSRESDSDNIASTKSKSNTKLPWGGHKSSTNKSASTLPKASVPDRSSSIVPNREAPRPPQRGNPNYFSSRDLGSLGISEQYKGHLRSPVLPVRDHRRSSLISLTDTISIHSFDSRPPSPPRQNEAMASGSPMNQGQAYGGGLSTPSPQRTRRQARPRAHTPSIYTLATHDSEASLVISSVHTKSAYGDSMALDSLRRSGAVRGMFPDFHLLRNITRYSRYASAVYGYNFLKLMGISKDRPTQNIADEIHYDVRSFAHHAKLPPDSILLASFVDPQGGSDSTGATDTGIPLVHTVALDEESKAVVLTCRGTLGFEDVLADMMCEYDDLTWRGKTYKVHKGIHASARRLLYGGDGRVLFTIKAALEEYPEYGLVLCGHSLGGAVTALLGVMLAEPSATGAGFLTSAAELPKLLSDANSSDIPTHICLPSGRPIHVYAYGPPATMSPSLQKATRGLITSTVHGNDMVPYLSLGVLHDFQALALAFKTDNSEAKAEVKRRVWEGLRSGLADKWYSNSTQQSNEDDEHWGYIALKTLRVSMMSSKLLPPGEVFKVDSTLVMRRDAFTEETIEDVGRPATRIVLKYIRDVEAHFREVRFGSSMLTDHSPGRYEDALRRLTLGVVDIQI
ncbi:hypothetical protein E0Z10_g3215 [Xylaria hypoxylon]|uniref:sn-1-specific diacylglycerol lipase n=1 Tax=Xylaria hypoxylon TaxID=37992 RepID=A0A4Z0YP29_9PEZI|nr:hypothetical protein E0Z10_g3215 [Xylaria hypoxylon]